MNTSIRTLWLCCLVSTLVMGGMISTLPSAHAQDDSDYDDGGFGGPGGGFGGRGGPGGRGGFGGGRGGFGGPGGERGGWGDHGGRDRGSDRSGDKGKSSTTNSQQKALANFVRELPESFRSYDANKDKQISFAEWPRARRAEFARFDRNGDGFLTPLELSAGAVAPVVAAAASVAVPVAAAAESRAGNDAGTISSESATNEESKESPEIAKLDRAVKDEARGYFGRLDANGNKLVEPTEWSVSKRLKPMFESAGVDLAKNLTEDEFILGYAKAKK